MDTGLTDTVAVITGAGAGIGLAITRALLVEGARVAAVDLDPGAAVAGIESDRAVGISIDLRRPAASQEAVDRAVDHFGSLAILVNNVGVAPFREGFLAVSDAEWLELMELNFLSMVRCCRAAIPHMLDAGAGSIVSIASDTARVPAPFLVDYSVTKGAILTLSRALANEFAAAGIRSNCVSPGPTRTTPFRQSPHFTELAAEQGVSREDAIQGYVRDRGMPLGRLGEAEDVAAVVVFLASALARQITGADYRVDGGLVPVA